MKRVVFTVCIDFDDEMELQEGKFIEELKQDLEKAVDNSGWYGIVDFVGIRSEKGPKGGV